MYGLTIGEAAKQARVRLETLRYYEREGLVASPPRSAANYRLYPEDTVRRVQFIKRAQGLGFSLKEIKELLSLHADPTTPCADVRHRALSKINDVEEKMRTLQAMKHALTQLVEACPGQGAMSDCPILASLAIEGRLCKVMQKPYAVQTCTGGEPFEPSCQASAQHGSSRQILVLVRRALRMNQRKKP
jgi:MerR family copper efflux transcriptional regulator